jgi:hypothetical protein
MQENLHSARGLLLVTVLATSSDEDNNIQELVGTMQCAVQPDKATLQIRLHAANQHLRRLVI